MRAAFGSQRDSESSLIAPVKRAQTSVINEGGDELLPSMARVVPLTAVVSPSSQLPKVNLD